MLEKVHLEDLINNLDGTVVKLNPSFLKLLLSNAAKSDRPWNNKEFISKIGCKYHKRAKCIAIKNWLNDKRNISFSKLKKIVLLSDYKWRDIERNLIFIKSKAKGKRLQLKFPLKIGGDIGSIIGHILGDGSIDRRCLQVFYSNSNKELLKEFQFFMKTVFNANPRIWYGKPNDFKGNKSRWIKRVNFIDEIPEGFQGGLFYPKMCIIILYAIFGKFAYGKHKEITQQILNANKEFKIGLIRAFFDDEGGPIENSYEIRVSQDNKLMLEEIRKMLLEISIESNSASSYYKNNKIRYYFTITGHYNFVKFYKAIGFTSTEKRNKLKHMIDNVIVNKTLRLRNNEARNNILEFLKYKNQLTTKEIMMFMKSRFSDFKWDKSTILEHLDNLEVNRKICKQKVGLRYLWKFNSV